MPIFGWRFALKCSVFGLTDSQKCLFLVSVFALKWSISGFKMAKNAYFWLALCFKMLGFRFDK